MKKAIFAISAALFLISCGGSSEGSVVVTDSVAVAVDTAAVTANDSTVAEIKADSVSVK